MTDNSSVSSFKRKKAECQSDLLQMFFLNLYLITSSITKQFLRYCQANFIYFGQYFWQLSIIERHVNSLPTFLPCLEKLSNSSERQRNPCSLATSGQLRIYRGIPICSSPRQKLVFQRKCWGIDRGKMVFTSRNRLDFHT